MNELQNIGKSLAKTRKSKQQNERRITKNTPTVERKLDIIASDTNYVLEFPYRNANNVMLNIYIKPDNCCECLKGYTPEGRQAWGDITGYEGVPPPTSIPSDIPASGGAEANYTGPVSDGLYHQNILSNIGTAGVDDSSWFAYPGYPFFHLLDGWDTNPVNRYGDFTSTSMSLITPTDGVYLIKYTANVTGVTTNTSKVTAAIRTRANGTDEWINSSTKIFSIEKGNLGEDFEYGVNGRLYLNILIYAICYPLKALEEVAGWIKAEDVLYWNPMGLGNGRLEVTLVGEGYGIITGIITDNATGLPLVGVDVYLDYDIAREPAYTDETGRYTFYNVRPGQQKVTASKSNTDGYIAQTQMATVKINEITTLGFLLTHL
jgi:hypothetical protein